MRKRKGLWGKFDELMSSLPDYIEEQTNQVTSGHNGVIVRNSHNNTIIGGSSTSTIVQDGKTIVVKTVKGRTTITVDGLEYEPKEGND